MELSEGLPSERKFKRTEDVKVREFNILTSEISAGENTGGITKEDVKSKYGGRFLLLYELGNETYGCLWCQWRLFNGYIILNTAHLTTYSYIFGDKNIIEFPKDITNDDIPVVVSLSGLNKCEAIRYLQSYSWLSVLRSDIDFSVRTWNEDTEKFLWKSLSDALKRKNDSVAITKALSYQDGRLLQDVKDRDKYLSISVGFDPQRSRDEDSKKSFTYMDSIKVLFEGTVIYVGDSKVADIIDSIDVISLINRNMPNGRSMFVNAVMSREFPWLIKMASSVKLAKDDSKAHPDRILLMASLVLSITEARDILSLSSIQIESPIPNEETLSKSFPPYILSLGEIDRFRQLLSPTSTIDEKYAGSIIRTERPSGYIGLDKNFIPNLEISLFGRFSNGMKFLKSLDMKETVISGEILGEIFQNLLQNILEDSYETYPPYRTTILLDGKYAKTNNGALDILQKMVSPTSSIVSTHDAKIIVEDSQDGEDLKLFMEIDYGYPIHLVIIADEEKFEKIAMSHIDTIISSFPGMEAFYDKDNKIFRVTDPQYVYRPFLIYIGSIDGIMRTSKPTGRIFITKSSNIFSTFVAASLLSNSRETFYYNPRPGIDRSQYYEPIDQILSDNSGQLSLQNLVMEGRSLSEFRYIEGERPHPNIVPTNYLKYLDGYRDRMKVKGSDK